MATEVQIFRKSLADEIGRDFVYVSATDEAKHFDGWIFLHQYAGELYLLFVGAGGKALWDHVKDEAVDLGKALGDKIWAEVMKSIAGLSKVEPTTDEKKQLDAIQRTEGPMAYLGKTLASSYAEDFLKAGRAQLLKRLRDDNLPPEKAERIAAKFAEAIRKRI